jgi:hypothetical protein
MSSPPGEIHGRIGPPPWDPQPGEPGTSFAGFVMYRETPATGRNLRRVALKLGRSTSLIERYSSRWEWHSRTAAWDAEVARRRSEQAREVEADWVERHVDAGKRLQALGLAGLSQAFERDPEGGRAVLRNLRPAEFLRIFQVGSAVEVTALTHATGTIEETFVHQLIEVISTVFVEANEYGDKQARAEAFEAGCIRSLRGLAG